MAGRSTAPSGDFFDGRAFSTAELREALAGQSALSRHTALLLLAGREYPERVTDLSHVLGNRAEPARLRILAAEMLGRVASPPAIAALRNALSPDDDALMLRSVVRGLGAAGDSASLGALDRLAALGGPAAGPAGRAAAVIRYRHGEPGAGIPRAESLLAPDPSGSSAIEPRPATRVVIDVAIKDLSGSLPSIQFDSDHAVAFVCEDRAVLVLLAVSGEPHTLVSRMLERRMLLAIVAQQFAVEDDEWEGSELVMSEPIDARHVRVAVVTLDGRLTMDGEATCVGERAEITLTAVAAPGAIPARAAATIDRGRLLIDRLEVGAERSRPMRPDRLVAERMDRPARRRRGAPPTS